MTRRVPESPVSRPVLLAGLLLMVTATFLGSAAAQADNLEQARQAYLKLDDEQALILVNEYLVGDPLHVNASDLRARLLMYVGRFPEAVQTLERLKSPPMRVRLLLAEVTALAGDIQKGLAMVDEIMLADPSAAIPRVSRARILLKAGQFQRARLELEQLRTTDPKNAEAAITLGMAYEGLRLYPDAVRQYTDFLQHPDSFRQYDPHLQRDAAEGTARAFDMMGQFENSVHWYEQLVGKFPDNPLYQFKYGIALGMRGRQADSISALEKAVELDPKNTLFRARLGDMYQASQELAKAVEQYEVILLNSEDPRLPTMRLTELYLEAGQLDKAIVHRDGIATLDPGNPRVQELIGMVCEKTGEMDKAKQCYRKAFELSSLQFQSMYRLGLLLSSSEDEAEMAEGKALLERYQRVAPYLADLERARNQARVNPNSIAVVVQIAGITNQAQEYKTAAEWARRAMQEQPANPQILALNGCIAANMGRADDAKILFKQAQDALVTMGQARSPKLQEYIETIEAGGELPLPLGEIVRPTQQTPEDGDPDGGNAPGNSADGGDAE